MTIDIAIRRLQAFIKWQKPDPNDNFHESVQLGIEALKRLKDGRAKGYDFFGHQLPGETEK